jgi:hypothetical protein
MGGNYIGATGLTDDGERFDELQENIDANASYINNLVGIPDPIHLSLFGINPLNPGLFGLVERAEVKIKLLETAEEGLGTDLTGLTTQVEGIQTEVTGIQTEILGIQGEITGIDSSISAIQFVQIPALGVLIGTADGIAVDARNKANRALDIWDYSGDNVYHKKAGNVGIGTTFGSTLTNKLEVQGNINIPTGSTFRINNEPFNYTHLAGEQPVSSKWTNATDVDTNIYYNSGNVGIGITTAINNKLEVAGNLNISAGSKYKINNVNLAFSDLAGSLSYNSLTNQLSGGTNIQILNGVINNTYELPKATTNAIGGVRPDGTTITINTSTGVISASAGAAQVNSDWTQTNTSLKSFIQNKPTAGTNISLANNTITNIIAGSPTQNIITLNDNYLIVKDKPDSQIVTNVDVPLTSGNEPTITSPAFTETIRTFTHSGGAEAQTTHTTTIARDTICDILVVGGGGGGGSRHAGGGGAGAVIYSTNITLTAGTYTIGVGKGGNGAVGGGGIGSAGQGNRGEDSRITFNSTNIYLAKGGGAGNHDVSTGNSNRDGGSGGGGGAVAGLAVSTNIPSGTYGNSGGILSTGPPESYAGGGGGGSGTAGSNAIIVSGFGRGGNGGNGTEISITGTNVYYGGGGGGGTYTNANNIAGTGGLGGGGAGSKGTATAVSGTAGTGGGGGGGGFLDANQGPGGAGGSGIVIIKLKSTTAIPEGNPITHKTLNFVYSTTPPNTYTLSVQQGTSIQVNNGTAQYLSGNYTISVGATQSSVVVAGIGQVGSDPYPLQNGSTIAIRYSMLQRLTSTINIKKDGLIKYVPASTINPTTGSWNIIDIDTQPLTQFAGNLPANRLDNIDMSKVATGNLPLSRTTETLPISRITGNDEGKIPINLTSGNLPASRLDNIDMGKVATGNLYYNRVQDFHLGINSQFHRIVYTADNIVDTQGIWTNKFKINTNLHLNQYGLSYNYYQYFLSMSPNNIQDRHKYWFGTVKMSTIVGTDNPANTQYYNIISNSMTNFDIRGTSSTQGVWWLDVWVYTTAYCESLIVILH